MRERAWRAFSLTYLHPTSYSSSSSSPPSLLDPLLPTYFSSRYTRKRKFTRTIGYHYGNALFISLLPAIALSKQVFVLYLQPANSCEAHHHHHHLLQRAILFIRSRSSSNAITNKARKWWIPSQRITRPIPVSHSSPAP